MIKYESNYKAVSEIPGTELTSNKFSKQWTGTCHSTFNVDCIGYLKKK
jgi:hypothetical protein